jgi:23S rRNA pseudouridine2457 synthase
LTNDAEVQHHLTDPKFQHPRTYWVQVEQIPTDATLDRLRSGLMIEGRKTRPAEVERLEHEPSLAPRPVPIRFRKSVPTCWLEVTLREGRNRQVRKMTAAVGHPTLRLVRVRIGQLSLGGLKSGEARKLSTSEGEQLRRDVGLRAARIRRFPQVIPEAG